MAAVDKNLAAFLRDDCYTVEVSFWRNFSRQDSNNPGLGLGSPLLNDRRYTYLTNIPGIKTGDHLIVLVNGILKVVCVMNVHETIQIEPGADIQYKWVVGKIDYFNYTNLMSENNKLAQLVGESYKKRLRNSFRDLLLADLDNKQEVLSILDKGVAK